MSEVVVGIPEKRHQHHVPQFFLKGFSDGNGRLTCLRREPSNEFKLLKNQNARNVCVEGDLYEAKVNQSVSEALFPNAIEDGLSSVECKQKQLLDIAKERIVNGRANAPLSDGELDSFITELSIILAGFVYRRPSEIKHLNIQVPKLVKAFHEQGLDSARELEHLFRDTTGYEEELPSSAFEPGSVAKLLLCRLNVLPYGLDTSTFLKTDFGQLAWYLRNCSVTCLVTDAGSSFAGLDFPTNWKFYEGVSAHYWPISKEVSVVFIDDRKHVFRKHEVNSAGLYAINEFALLNGEWATAFCSDSAEMERLYGILGEANEQD